MTTVSSIQFAFRYTHGSPLPQQSVCVYYNQQLFKLHLDDQGISQSIPLPKPIQMAINAFEMVDNHTGYPTHQQVFYLDPTTLKVPVISITVFPKPLIIDLGAEALLTSETIDYFKSNGNNALLFIHGFNVERGNYGTYLESFHMEPDLSIIEPHYHTPQEKTLMKRIAFKSSAFQRTVCLDLTNKHELTSQFPSLSLCFDHHFRSYRPEYNPEGMGEYHHFFNGTGALQWFVHMEYNFNRAAGYISHQYSGYTRILGVTWPGDLHLMSFDKGQQMAKQCAKTLRMVIQQLTENDITVNLIGHSLGCLLILELLNILNQRSTSELINHAVFWQPALPYQVLSNPQIFQPLQQLTVLYSNQDRILKSLYLTHQRLNPALGYRGPKQPIKHPKLVLVDQSAWLTGHSHMKVPSNRLFQAIYLDFIIGGLRGIQQFGKLFNFRAS